MAESVDCSEFCRICLVKDQANVPIFEEQGDMQQTYLKISTCLPIKVSYEDSLPKRICDGCNYKLEQQYQFWNTSLNAEKQLKQWLGIPDVPEVVEAPLKIKREKDSKANVTTKRPRRNARRKAAVNVRQVVAAVAASDSGPGEDMDMDNSFGKDDDMDHNDYNENSDALTDSPFINSNIDSEQVQAGPSGLQKNTDVENADVEETPGEIAWIKEESDYEEENELYVNSDNYEVDPLGPNYFHFLNPDQSQVHKTADASPYVDAIERMENSCTLYECNQCDQQFPNKRMLTIHLGSDHRSRKLYFCHVCKKPFQTSKSCKKHLSSHVIMKCEDCGKTFDSKRSYSIHQKVHSTDKPWKCPFCEKRFTQKQVLVVHTRTHTNEKPYKCEICGRFFTQRTPLVIHMRRHTGEKPYTCQICSEKFISKSYLEKHKKRVHFPT